VYISAFTANLVNDSIKLFKQSP